MAGLDVGWLSLVRRTTKNNRMTRPHNANHAKLEYRGRGCRSKVGFLRLIFVSSKNGKSIKRQLLVKSIHDVDIIHAKGRQKLLNHRGIFTWLRQWSADREAKWKDHHNEQVGNLVHWIQSRSLIQRQREKARAPASNGQKKDLFYYTVFSSSFPLRFMHHLTAPCSNSRSTQATSSVTVSLSPFFPFLSFSFF